MLPALIDPTPEHRAAHTWVEAPLYMAEEELRHANERLQDMRHWAQSNHPNARRYAREMRDEARKHVQKARFYCGQFELSI